MSDPVVIASYARTPMGSFQGSLAGVSATELGATAVKGAVERAGIDPDQVDRIYMGCVLPAGLGQAPARQAAIGAGLPQACRGDDRQQGLRLGHAGGDDGRRRDHGGQRRRRRRGRHGEHDQRAVPARPSTAAARGSGHGEIKDSMFLDGLEDAYDKGRAMGTFAEETAGEYQFTRQAQDDYAIASLTRAQAAQTVGRVRPRDRPRRSRRPQGHRDGHRRRTARQGRCRQDPDAEARLRQGRHDHRRQRLVDLRRRRRAGDDQRGQGARSSA